MSEPDAGQHRPEDDLAMTPGSRLLRRRASGFDLEPIPGYRLIERLGHGGFGEVWKAEAPGGFHKAVKLVYGKLSGSGTPTTSHEQVDRELKGLSRMKAVRHPYILSLERFDIIEGRLIIVMELADRDLADRLKECQEQGLAGIPRDELLKYLSEAAEALDFMSGEYEIQHLDIKPSNLFLVSRHVKVADFGLAKDLEGFSASVTSGMTPVYAAPETFSGVATRNTDQYSLAIVYEELLTGQRPFAGPTTRHLMLQHMTKDPNLEPLPEEDRPAVGRALAKEPSERFSTCSEFIGLLKEGARNRAVVAVPKTPVAGPAALAPTRTPLASEMASARGAAVAFGPAADEAPTKLKTRPLGAPDQPGAPAPATAAVIGIDLGTSNSVVAIIEGTEVKVLANQEGSRLTPSVVAFTAKGDRVVGAPAKRQAATNPRGTVHSIKRFMGCRREEVDGEVGKVPYEVVGEPGQLVRVRVGSHDYSPPEISAILLRKLKDAAGDYLGQEVQRAVITVPAYFNDSQRQATKDAGTIAGLEVLRIINEPTAASLAYGLEKEHQSARKIVVFDLGGGTFDITILRIRQGIFDVLATNGDTHLGGNDFDAALVDHFAEAFQKEHGIDPRKDPMALGRLLEAAERAKQDLSSQSQTDVNLPFLAVDAAGPKHLNLTITRTAFEQMTESILERCRPPCLQAMQDAKLRPEELDEVVLVGGSTRMPCVRRLIQEVFDKEPHKGVNPDEAVAVGAAVQAGMLAGGFEDLLLLDVTPLSLGLEAGRGVMSKLIERNTTVPTIVRKVFATAHNQQTEVGIHVVQGEREFARDNRTLGRFWLEGLRAAPAGALQIEVTFSIDANGILSVSAKDLETSQEQSIQVESSSGLSTQDVERMREEAERTAAEDRRNRELLEARDAADVALRLAEKQIATARLPEARRALVTKAIEKLREAAAGPDPNAIGSAAWQLDQVLGPVLAEKAGKKGR